MNKQLLKECKLVLDLYKIIIKCKILKDSWVKIMKIIRMWVS
jgi:hypothetical protein